MWQAFAQSWQVLPITVIFYDPEHHLVAIMRYFSDCGIPEKKKKHIMATTPWESHVTSDETRQRWALWRHCAQTGSILHLLKSAFDNMQVTVKGPIYPNCVKCIA